MLTKAKRFRVALPQYLSLTLILMAVNVAVFAIFLTVRLYSYFFDASLVELVVSFFALNPQKFIDKGMFWTLLTSMFAHFNFSHLLVNMISLFFIGSFVERIVGRKRYFWFYMISGLVAGLFFVGFSYLGLLIPNGEAYFGGISTSAVGASGALFGLGGLLTMLMPRLRVLVFFFIPMPLWAAMAVLLFGLWIFSVIAHLPVGNTAHFGGLVVGVVYGIYLRTRYARKIALLNRKFV